MVLCSKCSGNEGFCQCNPFLHPRCLLCGKPLEVSYQEGLWQPVSDGLPQDAIEIIASSVFNSGKPYHGDGKGYKMFEHTCENSLANTILMLRDGREFYHISTGWKLIVPKSL